MKTFLLSFAGAFVAILMFLALSFFGLMALAAALSPTERPPEAVVLSLDLRNEYSDQAPVGGFAAFAGAVGFTDLVQRLDAARSDDRVKGLFIRASEGSVGSARAEELRIELKKFRDAGKFVIAHSQGSFAASGPSSLRAISAADEIWLQPGTELAVSGISFETPFLKGLLDRLQVTAEIEQFHEYKNAPNTYKNETYTEPHREALLQLARSLWDVSLRDIAEDRGLGENALRAALTAGPRTAEDLREIGLIDQLGWPEDAMEAARGRVEDGEFLDLALYVPPAPPRSAPVIAVVGGEGPIITGGGGEEFFASSPVFASDPVARAILDAGEDEDVRAIVFRVDSPGGSPTASDQIHNAIQTVRAEGKPVVVSMGSVAASGGYYVSAGADHIMANRATITGSIGIFGGKLAIGEGLRSIGINFETVSVGGDYVDAFGVDAFTDTERTYLREILQRGYDRFLSLVAEGRGMTVEEVDVVARGRVWSGSDALGEGLVDSHGGFVAAIAKAKELAGVAPDEAVRLAYFPQRRTGFEALEAVFGVSGETLQAVARLNALLGDERFAAALAEIETLKGGVQARSPVMIER